MLYLPTFGWFGVAAALLFLMAILVVTMLKNLFKPKPRLKLHRILAIFGFLAALIHLVWALSYYL
jgi:DMSO/TMAO reductase YedYZ heme-binding membrane subunit